MAQHHAGFPDNTAWIPIPSSLSRLLEIGSASAATTYDGYNWLRQGQQIAPDAVCQMIHYKCAQANCGVQKSVTSTADGQIVETVYRGSHYHSRRLERSPEDGHTGNHLSGSQAAYMLPEVPASSGTLMPRAGQQEDQLSTLSDSEEEDDGDARASEDFAGDASAGERHVQAPAEQTRGGNIRQNKRRSKSKVWEEFTAVMKDGKIQSAECRHCKKCLSGKSSSGTSHLRRHLRICPAQPGIGRVQKQQSSSHPNTFVDKHSKFDQDKSLELLTRAFVSELCSFSLASSPNFRQFIAGICPTYDLASQSAVGDKFLDIFQNEKLKLKEEIALTPGGVLLAVAHWVYQYKHFISLTLHFIDKEWKMNRKIIKCCFLEDLCGDWHYFSMFPDWKSYQNRKSNGKKDGASSIIKEAVQYWSLEQKILGVTFDNLMGDAALLGLEEYLIGQNYLLAKWKLLTLPCMIDVLRNLISRFGIKTFVAETCEYWFEYMTCSPQRRDRHREIVSQLHLNRPSFGSQKWQLTHHLLEVALQFNKELPDPGLMDSQTYPLKPSREQLAATENFCSVARLIYDAIKEISSPCYATLNSYFDPIWKLKMALMGLFRNPDIEKVIDVKPMLDKFDKLWRKWYLWLSLAIVLDPRYKFSFLDYRFKQAFGSGAKQYIFEVRGKMYELFTQYFCYVDRRCDEHLNQRNNDLLFNTHGSVPVHDNTSQTYIGQASHEELGELFRYLQGNLIPLNVPFDILKWWKENASIYPTLARLARDLLVIPVSTVSVKSAFDQTDERVSLHLNQKVNPDVVEALICTQDWITSSEIDHEGGENRNVPALHLTMPPRFSPLRRHTTSGSTSSEY